MRTSGSKLNQLRNDSTDHSYAIFIMFKIMIIFNWNQNKVSWCIIENDYNFVQNENRVTVLLKLYKMGWHAFKMIE